MTPDLIRLQQATRVLADLFAGMEFELVNDQAWAEPSDTSYLTEEDRKDHDIMANITAMTQTNQCIAWFGRDANGYLGLWRGANANDLRDAPVVRLDSEGQYRIVAKTIPDYLAGSVDPDDFQGTKRTLEALGFQVKPSPDDIWESVSDICEAVNAYRHVIYNQERVRRGLKPL